MVSYSFGGYLENSRAYINHFLDGNRTSVPLDFLAGMYGRLFIVFTIVLITSQPELEKKPLLRFNYCKCYDLYII